MAEPTPEEFEAQQEIVKRVEVFGDDARKMGLYMEGFSVGVGVSPMDAHRHNHEGREEEEEVQTFMIGTFVVGEQAFSDRVLEPEKHDEDMTFRTLTAGADPFEVLREEMRKKNEDGKGPFDE